MTPLGIVVTREQPHPWRRNYQCIFKLTLTVQAELSFLEEPEQSNSFDCGVYLLHAAEYICLNYKVDGFFHNLKIPNISEHDCARKQSLIANVISNGFSTPKNVLLSFINQPTSLNHDTSKKHGRACASKDSGFSASRTNSGLNLELAREKASQTDQFCL